MKTKLWNLNNLLYLALILALLSSLGHVAFAFSTVNGGNWPEAYVSAIAIDVGLLALAAGINQRKTQRRGTWPLWLGVTFFSLISVYANWLAGLAHVKDIAGHTDAWLVSLRPILLSAVLPVLVIYLSEIVSSNYQVDQAAAAREAKRRTRGTDSPAFVPGDLSALDRANEARRTDVDQRRDQVLTLYQAGKQPGDIAQELDVSVRTIRRDIQALNGRVGVTQ